MKMKSLFQLLFLSVLMQPLHARSVQFDASAGYAPFYVYANSGGLGKANYTRFIGLSLRVGVWTPLGVAELDSLSGFEVSPYLQDISVLSLGLRRYLFRQDDFSPDDFWQQSSLRRFEPYYALGIGRLEQQSAFLTQQETIGILNLRSWGPSAALGVEWFFSRTVPSESQSAGTNGGVRSSPGGKSGPASEPLRPGQEPMSAVGEVRVLTAVWPESVPAFLFYKFSLMGGIRYRF